VDGSPFDKLTVRHTIESEHLAGDVDVQLPERITRTSHTTEQISAFFERLPLQVIRTQPALSNILSHTDRGLDRGLFRTRSTHVSPLK
jgi:hypothetical protein